MALPFALTLVFVLGLVLALALNLALVLALVSALARAFDFGFGLVFVLGPFRLTIALSSFLDASSRGFGGMIKPRKVNECVLRLFGK